MNTLVDVAILGLDKDDGEFTVYVLFDKILVTKKQYTNTPFKAKDFKQYITNAENWEPVTGEELKQMMQIFRKNP